jgi:hypothetical protein
MSTAIYSILEDLRHLPSADVSAAAEYVHQLRENRRERRSRMIEKTSGSLSGSDGDSFEAATQECEHLDQGHESW